MGVLSGYEPANVFQFFEELCEIPHGSGNTRKISDYCVQFAKDRELEVMQDETNNVVIRKGGSKGYESSEPVIIQGHLDMVCEKVEDSDHDFEKDGLELCVEDGFVKAKGTTLGGDDGIAVAMALAVLDSQTIEHPPIEAVFTVDEETGMTGASALDFSQIRGRKLLNIDSEEEGILTVGCAGGFRFENQIPVKREDKSGTCMEIRIRGLQGGHSGIEIHKQRGNAHKMMGRLLAHISEKNAFLLINVDGGSKDNVISMESTSRIVVEEKSEEAIREMVREMEEIWRNEFAGQEPNLRVEVLTESGNFHPMDYDSTRRVVAYLDICPNGVQSWSRELENMVETSLNLGIVESAEEEVRMTFLVRSSVETAKEHMKEVLIQCSGLVNAKTAVFGEYPGWQYNPASEVRGKMVEAFTELYGKEPIVEAVHAGLECGLFIGKCPQLDCISFGPDLLEIHSANERMNIASVQNTWKLLLLTLRKLK